MSDSQTKYQKFFNSALAKFGVKSPAELDDSKKKEFFNYVDDNFKGKNESTKAYGKALQTIAKDRKLKNISKKDRDTLIKIAQMMKRANELREDKEAYQKFFNSALSKFGVKSPAELEDDKKKEFFNYVDDNYKSANEAKNKGLWHNINAKKKRGEKSSPKNSKAYKDAKAAGEKINREKKKESIGESEDMLRNDKARFETYKMFLEKALKKAGIRVIKFKPMKSGWVSGNTVFGAFFTVKAASGNDTLPFYIDKKGYINLGVSSKDFIIGRLDKFQQVVKTLKDFKKTDLDEIKLNEREPVAKEKDIVKKLDNAYSFFLKFSKEIRDASKSITMADYKDIDRSMSFVNRDARKAMDKLEKAIKQAKKLGILESVNKKVTVKEVFKYLKTLEEYRYRKVPMVDVRRIASFINNGIKEDELPESLKKKWQFAEYGKEKHLANKFLKARKVNESTVTMDKDQMGKLHNDGEIVLVDPDGKEHKIIYNENTPLQAKMGAYTNVLHALEKFSKILNKAKETKKAKLALQMMKTLQKNFFANESIHELKHPRSKDLLDDVKQKVAKLIKLASGEHSDKVFDKIKPSAKALKAAEKLLTRVK
tara:strand:- start:94 stop:1881 length:1788 start_codon:yes stop_codon:yes gene_type:complete